MTEPAPLQRRARDLMRQHDWRGAASLLAQDVAEHPEDPWSRMFLGSCHYELHEYELALTHFRIAERLAPTDPTPIGLQADVFHAQGKRLEAGELYLRAYRMDPEDELAEKNLRWWFDEAKKRQSAGGAP